MREGHSRRASWKIKVFALARKTISEKAVPDVGLFKKSISM
jgi:hypothetical protein